MQIICRLYTDYMQIICRLYTDYMQIIYRLYADYMHIICRLYADFYSSCSAMCNFQPESNHYWQKVAYLVGAKSPATCQRKYEEMIYPINKEVVKKRYKGLIKKEREMKNLPDTSKLKI